MKTTIKDYAENLVITNNEPKYYNICELERIDCGIALQEATEKNKEGEYKVRFCEVNGKKYRVPLSVIKQLRDFYKKIPTIKAFSVVKKGEGMNTQYSVMVFQ